MAHDGCLQIPEETEAGWEAMPKVGDMQPVKATRPMPKWLKDYFTGNEKTGYTCRAPWMKYFEPLKTPACPKCPKDRQVATTIARLTKNIVANPGAQKYIGSRIHDWECIGTDGYRALLVLKPEKKGIAANKWPINDVPSLNDPVITLDDPNIFLAIKRLATLIREEKDQWVQFDWNHETEQLILTARNSYREEGVERFSCSGTFSGKVKLDPQFVTPMLGTWPLNLYHQDNDPKRPVVFMPNTKKREFMYVLMTVNI
jgi:hypothetical protein